MKNNHEEVLQRSIWAHVQLRGNPRAMIFHVPNGEARSKATGGRLKAMGVVAGVADFVAIMPNGKVCMMELKRPGGKLSPAQEAFQAKCMRMDVPHCIAADIDTALWYLEGWEIILPETKLK